MRILVTGANGRLGSYLVDHLKHLGHTPTGVDIEEMDIGDPEAVDVVFRQSQPELVIHCAALTAVDYCAEHPDEALQINGFGTQTVARACLVHDAALMYISTNEVFDGRSNRSYLEYDQTNPVNAYGYSKWVGEQAVRELVSRHYVVRTSWLFAHGGGNFIHAILKRAQQQESLRVVINEIGSPTYNNDLVHAIGRLLAADSYGTFHLANEGYTSRYNFARRALDLAGFEHVPVERVTLAEFQRASRPPEYAALKNTAAAQLGIRLRPWEEALADFLAVEGLLKS